jgi:hypothetical protein
MSFPFSSQFEKKALSYEFDEKHFLQLMIFSKSVSSWQYKYFLHFKLALQPKISLQPEIMSFIIFHFLSQRFYYWIRMYDRFKRIGEEAVAVQFPVLTLNFRGGTLKNLPSRDNLGPRRDSNSWAYRITYSSEALWLELTCSFETYLFITHQRHVFITALCRNRHPHQTLGMVPINRK